MQRFEYKVIPAPKRGKKVKGVKSSEDRFAHTLMELMNDLAQDGWAYQRTDTLPVETRSGLASRTLIDQTVLVFRRAVQEESDTSTLMLSEPIKQGKDHNAPALSSAKPSAPSGAPTVGPAPADSAD